MKAFLLKIYDKLYYVPKRIVDFFFSILNFLISKTQKPPKVMGIDETMDYIIRNRPSIARFGDGEIKLANGTDISFQNASPELTRRMREVLAADDEEFLPCILSFFDYDPEATEYTNNHWKKHMSRYRHVWYRYTKPEIYYGNSFISRFYIEMQNKELAEERFKKLKQFWDGRNVIIVEGEQSRIGIGNDLFDNVRSVKRILCPVRDAFDSYDKIFNTAKKYGNDDVLFILAVGPTATVLAYDLFKCGFQALDVGHADIEYEWFLAGATEKQPVKNKFVNEAGQGKGVGDIDDKEYLAEIVERI